MELFLGLPLFPGSSEYNQVSRITEMLGLAPTWMLEMGKQSGEFFEKTHDEYGRRNYRLKSMEQYSREHNSKEQPSKKYFQATTLPEIIRSYAMPRKNMKQSEIDRGKPLHPRQRDCWLIGVRNDKPSGVHRFCSWLAEYQSTRTMVTSASKAPPFHHTAEIYRSLRTTNAPKNVILNQITRTWCTAAAGS